MCPNAYKYYQKNRQLRHRRYVYFCKQIGWGYTAGSKRDKMSFSKHLTMTDVNATGLRSFKTVTFGFLGVGTISEVFHMDGNL